MKVSDYLHLEAAIPKKIITLWKNPSEQVAALVYAKQYDDARELIMKINLADLNVQKYISAILQSSAAYGSFLASGEAVSPKSTIYEEVAARFMTSLQHTTSVALQDSLLAYVSKFQNDPDLVLNTKKEDSPKDRFVKDFVSFADDSDSQLRLISSLHTSRLSTFGFVSESEYQGITQYKLSAVIDGRTSDFCRMINGHTFEVQDAKTLVLTVLSASAEDAKTLQPWPSQTKDALARYSEMSTADLVNARLHIPPFHPVCRTLCVREDYKQVLLKPSHVVSTTTDDAVLSSVDAKSQYTSVTTPPTREDLQAIKLSLSVPALQAWNSVIKVLPEQAIAALTNLTEVQVKAGALEALKLKTKVGPTGNLAMQFEKHFENSTPEVPKVAKTSFVLNPIEQSLKLSYMDLYNVPENVQYSKDLLANSVELALENGLKKFIMPMQGTTTGLFSKFGFALESGASVKSKIAAKITKLANLSPQLMPPADKINLESILASPSFSLVGLQLIANYPLSVGGGTIGKYLLDGLAIEGTLDLTNPHNAKLFIAYLQGTLI